MYEVVLRTFAFYISAQTAVAQVSPLLNQALICLQSDAKAGFEIESVPYHHLSKNGVFLGGIYKFHSDIIEGFRDWDAGWEALGTRTLYKETKTQLFWSLPYLGGMGGFTRSTG